MMSNQQKQIRLQIENSSDTERNILLKAERKEILKQMKSIANQSRDEEIDKIVEEIDEVMNDTKMFKAVKALNRKKHENPFVHNKDGAAVTNTQEIYSVVEEHFKQYFSKENLPEISRHSCDPRPLQREITKEEVQKAVNKMSNNKAPGKDNMPIELVKYAPNEVHEIYASAYSVQ